MRFSLSLSLSPSLPLSLSLSLSLSLKLQMSLIPTSVVFSIPNPTSVAFSIPNPTSVFSIPNPTSIVPNPTSVVPNPTSVVPNPTSVVFSGKLCLQNEELTKKCVAQMSKELETSDCPAVKNNVIVVLCDLAVRYSARIDPYIPVISSCMKDPSLMVRKQSLTLLTHLLQEDFVKWKGSLFFRFISTLLDDQLKKFGEECVCVCVCVGVS